MTDGILKAVVLVMIVVGFIAIALWREGARVDALKTAVQSYGLELHSPYTPSEYPPMVALAKRLDGRSDFLWSPRWGAGITGMVDGRPITIAEHEVPAQSMNHSTPTWYALLVWAGDMPAPSKAVDLPHTPEMTFDGHWVALRLKGNLNSERIAQLLAHLPQANGGLKSHST